jgi:CRP-like cAMP-binding protein
MGGFLAGGEVRYSHAVPLRRRGLTLPSETTTPVTRVGLKRLHVGELVRTDALLRGCGLLRALDELSLARLLGDAVARRYPQGALLRRDADSGERPLLLILSGEVMLLAGADGAAAEVGVARKGEVLGEEGLLPAGSPPGASLHAVAQGPVDVAELPLEAVRGAAAAIPALAHYLDGVRGARAAACSEMSDFLGRW